MSFCPSKDIHSVYLDGELPENYKVEYEQHIAGCEECRKTLAQLKAVRAMFKADADSINLDEKFMNDSFQRLQIKMAYNKNIGYKPNKSSFKPITYIASGIAAAAVIALAIPLSIKAKAGSEPTVASNVINSPLVQSVSAVPSMPITAVTANNKTSSNNVSFDSGRSVVVSGNIKDVVLSSETQRKVSVSTTKKLSDVDVLKPDFQDETISIKITVPGIGDFPVTTEINVPMDTVSGRY